MFEIHNIFDAGYVTYFVYQLQSKIGLDAIKKLVAGSLRYKVRQLQKGDRFPPESEWVLGA
jgi:hypothetical protein